MAKKSNYHGFDDAKNVVEAPHIYLDNNEVDVTTSVSQSNLADAQGNDSIVVMKCSANASYPGGGMITSLRTNTGEAFQVYYGTPYNSVYISGRNNGNIHPWQKLMTPADLEKVWKQQVRILPFTTEKVMQGTAAQAVVKAGAHQYDLCYARTLDSNYEQMNTPVVQNDGSVLVNMVKVKNAGSGKEGCSGALIVVHVYWKEYNP